MKTSTTYSDITLIGAGIMSATLGTFLKELAPQKSITMFEQLSAAGLESSNEWNNAGTGHSALCELNYTEENAKGDVEVDRALNIFEQFQLSLQLWSYLVAKGKIQHPQEFIRPVPHISFVSGEKNVNYLKKRYEKLIQNPLYAGMKFSEEHSQLKEWMPLMMKERNPNEKIAASYTKGGTDMNFGALTRKLFAFLAQEQIDLHFNHQVKDLNQQENGEWLLTLNNESGETIQHRTKFVFLGCGGGTLPLLQKSGIAESKNVGGLPVSGLFLVCKNPQVVAQHQAKVYGKAKIGAPPMSVPHLDARFINGTPTLLFGPFAGFTSKFLKSGSFFDLPLSIKADNVISTVKVGIQQLPLAYYLIKQTIMTKAQRMADLREFIPTAKDEDWEVITAGQRVQIIRNGELRFGTEVISSQDKTFAALLGASPGASISVKAMLDVLTQCFADELPQWQEKLLEIIPSFGQRLNDNPALYQQIRQDAEKHLAI